MTVCMVRDLTANVELVYYHTAVRLYEVEYYISLYVLVYAYDRAGRSVVGYEYSRTYAVAVAVLIKTACMTA